MRGTSRRAFLGLLLAAALPACRRRGPDAAKRTEVIALLGDEPVEEPGLSAYVKTATGEPLAAVSPQVASSLLDQYLEELLLDRMVEAAVPKAAGQTAAERRADVIGRRARLDAISDADLRAAYDANSDRYAHPPLVRLSQLVLPSREKAELAKKRLKDGVAWLEVSRQLSVAPNASTGGSLGLLAAGEMPAEFEKAIRSVPAGGVTPPVATGHGLFHLFRVDERTSERVVPFEEARPALRLTLAQERSAEAVKALVEEARKRWPPRVVEEHLPFAYVGTMPQVGPAGRR